MDVYPEVLNVSPVRTLLLPGSWKQGAGLNSHELLVFLSHLSFLRLGSSVITLSSLLDWFALFSPVSRVFCRCFF